MLTFVKLRKAHISLLRKSKLPRVTRLNMQYRPNAERKFSTDVVHKQAKRRRRRRNDTKVVLLSPRIIPPPFVPSSYRLVHICTLFLVSAKVSLFHKKKLHEFIGPSKTLFLFSCIKSAVYIKCREIGGCTGKGPLLRT